MSPAEDPAFERLLVLLRETRGFDFTAYKRSSLMRRVSQRMHVVGVRGFDGYLGYLEAHAEEFRPLFNTILINATRFFRDEDVWDAIRDTVIPALLGSKAADAPLRVWSAGAAAGQEAYSAAMLLADQLGREAFHQRVKIYATDVDDDALRDAQRARYTEKQLDDVPEAFRGRYFEGTGDRYTVKRELRQKVVFTNHDLLRDAPIPGVDLVLCRNTLMYFDRQAQARAMAKFAYSIEEEGFVVLGRAEMLVNHGACFEPVEWSRCIFRTAPAGRARADDPLLPPARAEDQAGQPAGTVTWIRDLQRLQAINERRRTRNQALRSELEQLETSNEQALRRITNELRSRGQR